MSSGSYMDTYNVYKAGTTKIATWLVQTARLCGYDAKLGSKDSLRKTNGASKTAKHIIPLGEFTNLAKVIAEATKPKIGLPSHIASLLRNVIGLRRDVAELFSSFRTSKKKQAAKEKGDAGHQHFITVLETVLSTLHVAQEPETQEADAPRSMENMFALLAVEEPPESPSSTSGKEAATKPSKSASTVHFELEQTEEDAMFAIAMFFKDVNAVRKNIQGVWKDYREGKVDVMSAAVTTDTAFTLLRHSCDSIQESVPGKPNFTEMVMTLQSYVGDTSDSGPAFIEWTCILTAQKLEQFQEVLSQSSVPILKPGHFGVYNPRQDRTSLTPDERNREDYIVLMELLPEFAKLSKLDMDVPAQDELTRGLRKLMAARTLTGMPTYTYFCTQILLDIHHVLREDASKPFQELQDTSKRVIDTLDGYFKFSRGKGRPSTWPQQNDQVIRYLSTSAKEWGLQDRVGQALAAAAINSDGRRITSQPFHLLKNHPVLAGLMVFRLNLLMNEFGIDLCNAWGSAIYPAHLYNAAKQSAGLDAAWQDIDYVSVEFTEHDSMNTADHSLS